MPGYEMPVLSMRVLMVATLACVAHACAGKDSGAQGSGDQADAAAGAIDPSDPDAGPGGGQQGADAGPGTEPAGGSGGAGGDRGAGGTGGTAGGGEPTAGDFHYKVDQFGYLPFEAKVAVISQAVEGAFSPDSFQPGSTLQVQVWSTGEVVFSGAPVVWNGGEVDPLCGDRGWWFDFSTVSAEGEYVIYDVERDLYSHVFRIAEDVYRDAMMQSMRTFYYQREGIAKQPPYADPRWVDDVCFSQDLTAHYVHDPDNDALIRDLSGGWMDAGDTNKYVTNTSDALHDLLTTFRERPGTWQGKYAVLTPPSGNYATDISPSLFRLDRRERSLVRKPYDQKTREGNLALAINRSRHAVRFGIFNNPANSRIENDSRTHDGSSAPPSKSGTVQMASFGLVSLILRCLRKPVEDLSISCLLRIHVQRHELGAIENNPLARLRIGDDGAHLAEVFRL